MTKEELVVLFKQYKENVAKLKLKEKEKFKIEKYLNKLTVEYDYKCGSFDYNSSIRSKNKNTDSTGQAVACALDSYEINKKEAKKNLLDIEKEIDELKEKIEEVDIRLDSLYYKDKQIVYAYYIENRTAEEVGQNLCIDLFQREFSKVNVYKIINSSVERMLNL